MMINLDALRPGMQAVVTQIRCGPLLRQRLADLGLVSGTRLACRYRSPGGNVTALELRGTVIAIRTVDLKNLSGRLL